MTHQNMNTEHLQLCADAGVADPEKEIAAMREAIQEAGAALDDYDIVSALAKLQPFIQ